MSTDEQDLEVCMPDQPGSLALLTAALGTAGVSLEGGGAFSHAGRLVAHFLVSDAQRARAAVLAAGIGPVRLYPVVTTRLDQEAPGQLAGLSRRLVRAGVHLRVQYSDHDGRVVLVVAPEHLDRARRVAASWPDRGAARTDDDLTSR